MSRASGLKVTRRPRDRYDRLMFELPPTPADGQRWQRCIDTALASPDDIRPLDQAPAVAGSRYVVEPRSVVLLALVLRPSPAV